MQEIDFLITYELVQRELENVLLLKKELKDRGFRVEIVKYPFRDVTALRKKYLNNVKMVITHSMYTDTTYFNLVYKIAGKVKKILNLRWEQVGTVQNEKNTDFYTYPNGIAKKAAHICWGSIPKKNLLSSGMSAERLFQDGPIQMDFLNEKFSTYYKKREELLSEYNLNNEHLTILFISSFSYVNLSESAVKRLSKQLDRKYVEEFQEFSSKSQAKIFEWIERFLSEVDNVTFIYRLHPAEVNNNELKQLNNKFSNFEIISDYSVKQWINTVDRVVSWYSTSIAEAYFANKPYFILRPFDLPYEKEVSILVNEYKITNYNTFKDSLINNVGFNKDSNIIPEYYDVDPTYPSYKRVADTAEKILNSKQYDIEIGNKLSLKFFLMYIHSSFKNSFNNVYYYILRLGSYIEEKYNIKIEVFDLNKRIANYKKQFIESKKIRSKVENEAINKINEIMGDL